MSVQVARNFPSIVQYDMKGALNGKTFYGQPDRINTVKINGVSIALTKEDVKKMKELLELCLDIIKPALTPDGNDLYIENASPNTL